MPSTIDLRQLRELGWYAGEDYAYLTILAISRIKQGGPINLERLRYVAGAVSAFVHREVARRIADTLCDQCGSPLAKGPHHAIWTTDYDVALMYGWQRALEWDFGFRSREGKRLCDNCFREDSFA